MEDLRFAYPHYTPATPGSGPALTLGPAASLPTSTHKLDLENATLALPGGSAAFGVLGSGFAFGTRAEPFFLRRKIDENTPRLFDTFRREAPIANAAVDLLDAGETTPTVRYELEDVHILSYPIVSTGAAGQIPLEEIELEYRRICECTKQPNGTLSLPVCWSPGGKD